jgi:hypothetical protein
MEMARRFVGSVKRQFDTAKAISTPTWLRDLHRQPPPIPERQRNARDALLKREVSDELASNIVGSKSENRITKRQGRPLGASELCQ